MARNSNYMRPLSADCTPRSSILLAMLPSVVKSRLPRLPSLHGNSVYSHRSTLSAPASGSRTPSDEFGNALVLSGGSVEDAYFADQVSSEEDFSRARGKGKALESQSGVDWKFANQGLNLLSLAGDEASTISQDPGYGNAGLARQLYIHSLTYLLRGLPTDLSRDEQHSIRSALPSEITEPLRLEMNSTTEAAPREPSLLQRTLATTIVQLFLIFQLLLPYLKYFLAAAYTYEREHKISERILSQSIETGKKGVDMAGILLAMGDGTVGRTVQWVIEGVTGGIHDGLGEGMAILAGAQLKKDGEDK